MKGGTTSTIRRHLENEHKEVYFRSIQLYQLRRERISELDEPFSLERWISLLIDWIVADDQVSSTSIDCSGDSSLINSSLSMSLIV
jgi:hypothetical protein